MRSKLKNIPGELIVNHDHAYILQLRAKLRSAENQLAAMTI